MEILQKLLGEIGLPILRDIVDKTVPGGGPILDIVADTLGVKKTPEAVAAEIQKDPSSAYTKLETVETDYAAIARAASDALISYHRVLEIDAKSSSWVVRYWRPLNGIGFGLAAMAVTLTACVTVLRAAFGSLVDLSNLGVIIGVVAPTLTVWAGVVGAYVFKRTEEKKSGVQ